MEPKDDHCWHVEELAIVKMVNPSLWPIVCCWCGARANAAMRRNTLPGHGEYARIDQLVYPPRNTCYPK
jgi:hypothetical protein